MIVLHQCSFSGAPLDELPPLQQLLPPLLPLLIELDDQRKDHPLLSSTNRALRHDPLATNFNENPSRSGRSNNVAATTVWLSHC